MKTICAWCWTHLSGPVDSEKISHGICPDCEWEHFPEPEPEAQGCRCVNDGEGRRTAVIDARTCAACAELDGADVSKIPLPPVHDCYSSRMKPPGVWAVCVPTGSEELSEFRHLFESEEKLWGCAGITSRCNVTFALDRSTVFIGGVSISKSGEACPECLDSLNREEVTV